MCKGPVAEGSAVSAEASSAGPRGVVGPSPEQGREPSEDWGLEMPGFTWGCLF